MNKVILVLAFALVTFPCLAKDRLELDEASIQGARELPKVLYILPWKKAESDDKPVKMQTMVDEVMAPVDRSVLERQIRYYQSQHKKSEETDVK